MVRSPNWLSTQVCCAPYNSTYFEHYSQDILNKHWSGYQESLLQMQPRRCPISKGTYEGRRGHSRWSYAVWFCDVHNRTAYANIPPYLLPLPLYAPRESHTANCSSSWPKTMFRYLLLNLYLRLERAGPTGPFKLISVWDALGPNRKWVSSTTSTMFLVYQFRCKQEKCGRRTWLGVLIEVFTSEDCHGSTLNRFAMVRYLLYEKEPGVQARAVPTCSPEVYPHPKRLFWTSQRRYHHSSFGIQRTAWTILFIF